MADNIKQKTMTNLIWRFGERCGAQIVQFIVSIVLERRGQAHAGGGSLH